MKQPNRLELIDICCRIVSEGPVTLEERIWMTKLCEHNPTAKRIADDQIPSAKQTSSQKLLGKNNDTKKSALERLLEKFR